MENSYESGFAFVLEGATERVLRGYRACLLRKIIVFFCSKTSKLFDRKESRLRNI